MLFSRNFQNSILTSSRFDAQLSENQDIPASSGRGVVDIYNAIRDGFQPRRVPWLYSYTCAHVVSVSAVHGSGKVWCTCHFEAQSQKLRDIALVCFESFHSTYLMHIRRMAMQHLDALYSCGLCLVRASCVTAKLEVVIVVSVMLMAFSPFPVFSRQGICLPCVFLSCSWAMSCKRGAALAHIGVNCGVFALPTLPVMPRVCVSSNAANARVKWALTHALSVCVSHRISEKLPVHYNLPSGDKRGNCLLGLSNFYWV